MMKYGLPKFNTIIILAELICIVAIGTFFYNMTCANYVCQI